jgi:polygalacturonase
MIKKIFFSFLYVSIPVLVLLSSCAPNKQYSDNSSEAAWKYALKNIEKIKEPVFPNTVFDITSYGAKGDGIFNNTEVFKKAIQLCSQNGGGMVLVPAGKFFTGPIHLESNVNLHIEEGAEIMFSTNPSDYPLVVTSFEGLEVMNYSPLLYAYQKTNVAITGKGTINGQGNNLNWWPWCGKDTYGWKKGSPTQNVAKLMKMAEDGVPVTERIFGDGNFLRPNFVEFFECTNVMLKDLKIINAPFWVIHPIKSTNVIIDGVTVTSHGPNNDGCDPEYSKNVIIRNCNFNTGDDCIAIKSGRDTDGRRVGITSENIYIQNCKMYDGHGGVTIGSEISAGVRNVFVENCMMDSPELDRAFRIKSNSRRGGFVENLYARNIQIGEVGESVLGIDLFYSVHGNQSGTFLPRVENIYLENVKVKNGGKFAILAKGHKGTPIKNIQFNNVIIDKVKTNFSLENVENLKFTNTSINGVKIENAKN